MDMALPFDKIGFNFNLWSCHISIILDCFWKVDCCGLAARRHGVGTRILLALHPTASERLNSSITTSSSL